MNRLATIIPFIALGLIAAFAPGPSIIEAQELCDDWTQVEPPIGATSVVLDVTALSRDEAWAVAGTLGTIRWDGMAWSQVPLPDLSSLGTSSGLDAITTIAPGHFFAAGHVVTSVWTSEQLLLEWSGGDWQRIETVELVPNIAGAPRGGAARDIAGAAPNDVWIVGTASGFGTGVGGPPVLTIHWDGSQLTEVITPGPGERQNHLYGAAAVATDDVWAVGYYNNVLPNGVFHSMTLHWDGDVWNHVPNPGESLDQTFLYDVVALASDDVWAAGKDLNGPLFMHWDGIEWTIVPGPEGVQGTIQALAAIATDDVWAVDSPWAVPLISKYYHWDGTSWSVVIPPAIPGAVNVNRAGGLAAVGPCDVWAVGSTSDGQTGFPFIERLQPVAPIATAVEIPNTGPSVARLEVAPNPMRRALQIHLQIPVGAALERAQVFDSGGRLITVLSGRVDGSQSVRIAWDGHDAGGRVVSGGVYFVRAVFQDGRALTRKVALLP